VKWNETAQYLKCGRLVFSFLLWPLYSRPKFLQNAGEVVEMGPRDGQMCGNVAGFRHYATSRKVAVSIPDEVIGFFSLPNPSSRTMAQPLTEMSTRNLPGG
jgi:hypothetical protein